MGKNASQGHSAEPLTYKEGLLRAAGLCSRQEQCSGVIHDKLLLWGLSEKDAEKVLKKLREEKYLDDERFARFFTRDKLRFNGWGPRKITYALRQKHLAKSIIEEALAEIEKNSWQEKCNELIRAKARGLKEKDTYSRKGKLFRFAAGRGFDPEQIYRSMEALEEKT